MHTAYPIGVFQSKGYLNKKNNENKKSLEHI